MVNSIGGFSVRFMAAGIFNYVFANLIFTVLWFSLGNRLGYVLVSLITAPIAITLSYTLHRLITLRGQGIEKKVDVAYFLFQFFQFLASLAAVPILAQVFDIFLLYIQYAWTILASLVGVAIIHRQKRAKAA